MSADSLWRYKVDGLEAEAGWYESTFAGTWPTAVASSLPTPSGKVSYYCTTFDVTNVVVYSMMTAEVTTRGGYRMFLNGQEVGRSFLGYNDLTFETEPIEEVETARSLKMALSFGSAKVAAQDNLMCIEVRTKTVDTANHFSCTITLTESNVLDLFPNGASDGSLGYSHTGYYDSQWQENYPNLIDKATNNKWYVEDNSVYQGTSRAWITWKWSDNRVQAVNYLKYYTGNMPDRRPINLAVYGTNDDCGSGLATSQTGITWTFIYQTQPGFTTASYGTYKEFDFTNDKP